MTLTAAELRAVYVVDEGPLDKSLAGLPGKVGKVKPGDVKIGGDDKGFQQAAASTEKRAGLLATSLKSSLGAVAGFFALNTVVGFFKGANDAASDLGETVNKSNVIFGRNAAEVNAWAKTSATSVGLSRQAALEAAAGFGDMFSQIGFAGDQAAKLSTKVVQMSADLGSFNNLPTADVADMISAAFRGEYDSLQRLIPNINAARVEQEAMAATGKKSADQLTAQEKAAAVLAIVQKDGARAMGDFSRTADQQANSSKILAAQWQDAKARLGELLNGPVTGIVHFLTGVGIPAFEGLIGVVTTVLGVFGDLPGPVQAAIVTLAALAALKGPAGDALEWITLKAINIPGALERAGGAMGLMKNAGSGLVGFFGGPWGLAIAGAVAGTMGLAQWLGNTTKVTEGTKKAQQELAAALRESNGELTDSVRRAAAKAAQDADLLDMAEKLGIGLDTVTSAVLGNKDAYEQVDAALERYQTRAAEKAGNESDLFARAIEDTNRFRNQLDELAPTVSQTKSDQEQLAKATGETAAKHDAAADAAKAQDEALQALKDTFDAFTGKAISVAEAQIDVNDGLRAFTDSINENGASLEANTAKGDANRSAVLEQIKAIQDLSTATFDQTGKVDEARGAYEREMGALRQRLIELGYNEQAVDEMIRLYGRIPEEEWTGVYANTGQASGAVAGIMAQLAALPYSKTVYIDAVVRGANQVSNLLHGTGMFGGPKRAAGGPVWPGETFLVGEDGPELVRFTGTGTVIPAGQTQRLLSSQAGVTARVPVGATVGPSSPAPASTPYGGGDRGPLFEHNGPMTIIEGTPDDVARQLELGARTRGNW